MLVISHTLMNGADQVRAGGVASLKLNFPWASVLVRPASSMPCAELDQYDVIAGGGLVRWCRSSRCRSVSAPKARPLSRRSTETARRFLSRDFKLSLLFCRGRETDAAGSVLRDGHFRQIAAASSSSEVFIVW